MIAAKNGFLQARDSETGQRSHKTSQLFLHNRPDVPSFSIPEIRQPVLHGGTWGNHRALSPDEGFFLPAIRQAYRFPCSNLL